MKTLKQYIIDEIEMDIYEIIDKKGKKHKAIDYDYIKDIANNIVKYLSLCAVGQRSELFDEKKCTISFVGNSMPSEKFKQLKEAIIEATEQIDKETVWQSYEPDWWTEMMDLQKEMR